MYAGKQPKYKTKLFNLLVIFGIFPLITCKVGCELQCTQLRIFSVFKLPMLIREAETEIVSSSSLNYPQTQARYHFRRFGRDATQYLYPVDLNWRSLLQPVMTAITVD